ncbi:hypothetical protein [Rhodococcus qingshengii]|uniref:hypothetical protein n=1 Tax=Rhodococcus qingshengii TaxID=334542 RepID=UPI002942617A|nr:hypothetical protein [Rhodococcus qingshengii]WOI85958.1 hypothetical protein R0122_22525 [Rhodococcus qingshengii]
MKLLGNTCKVLALRVGVTEPQAALPLILNLLESLAGKVDASANAAQQRRDFKMATREIPSPEPIANELEQRLSDAVETVPTPETLSNEQLLEVMETLAGISYDIAKKLDELTTVAQDRGIDL